MQGARSASAATEDRESESQEGLLRPQTSTAHRQWWLHLLAEPCLPGSPYLTVFFLLNVVNTLRYFPDTHMHTWIYMLTKPQRIIIERKRTECLVSYMIVNMQNQIIRVILLASCSTGTGSSVDSETLPSFVQQACPMLDNTSKTEAVNPKTHHLALIFGHTVTLGQ